MIKPILRVMPTMSGNVKLACTLLDYIKTSDNIFETNIRGAHLYPISSSLFQKSIKASLLNSSWEFDVKKFYAIYSDVFYNTNFEYDKTEMIKLDRTNDVKVRNTDFEYGVKRVSYQKSGCQYACFAPIYIDDVNDIPAYFKLNVTFTGSKQSTTKTIKVNIANNKESDFNHIYKYISKYVSKIDDEVAYMDNTLHNIIYYGIDLIKGGFTKKIDSETSSLFTIQMPTQQFDRTITTGFERNTLVIRQTLPLCFYFNIDDILNVTEKVNYKYANITFSGCYVDRNGTELPWYDFSWDYEHYNNDILTMNPMTGALVKTEGFTPNILNVGFPSFYDRTIAQYQFANKLAATFGRWKLKYSPDDWPYVTNMSWSFSNNQDSNYRYREFPAEYLYQSAFAVIDENNNYNMKLPLGDDKKIYDVINPKSAIKYKSIMNNYCLSWFDTTEFLNHDDIVNHVDDIYWGDVKDGYVYYKSILYNFNNLYNNVENFDESDKVDKFAFLVYPDTSNIIGSDNIKGMTFSSFNILPAAITNNDIHANCIFDNDANEALLGGSLFKFTEYSRDQLTFNDMYDKIPDDELDMLADDDIVYMDANELGIDLYKNNVVYKVNESQEVAFLQSKYRYFNDDTKLSVVEKEYRDIYKAVAECILNGCEEDDFKEWITRGGKNNLPTNKYDTARLNRFIYALYGVYKNDCVDEVPKTAQELGQNATEYLFPYVWKYICAVLHNNYDDITQGKFMNYMPSIFKDNINGNTNQLYEQLPVFRGQMMENNSSLVFCLKNCKSYIGNVKLKDMYINYNNDGVFSPELLELSTKNNIGLKTKEGINTTYDHTVYYRSNFVTKNDIDSLDSTVSSFILYGYSSGDGAAKFPMSTVGEIYYKDQASGAEIPASSSWALYQIVSILVKVMCERMKHLITIQDGYFYYPYKQYNGYDVGTNIAYPINPRYNEFTNSTIYYDSSNDEEGTVDGNVLYVDEYLINTEYTYYGPFLDSGAVESVYAYGKMVDKDHVLTFMNMGSYSTNKCMYKQYKTFAVDTTSGYGSIKYAYQLIENPDEMNNYEYDSSSGMFYDTRGNYQTKFFNIVKYGRYYKINKQLWDIINIAQRYDVEYTDTTNNIKTYTEWFRITSDPVYTSAALSPINKTQTIYKRDANGALIKDNEGNYVEEEVTIYTGIQNVTFTLPIHAYKYTIGNNKTPAELKVGDIVIFDESNYYGIISIAKFQDGRANITIQTTIDHPEENIFNIDLIDIAKIKQEIAEKHDNYSQAKIEEEAQKEYNRQVAEKSEAAKLDLLKSIIKMKQGQVIKLNKKNIGQDMFVYRPLLDVEYDEKYSHYTNLIVTTNNGQVLSDAGELVTKFTIDNTDSMLYPCFNKQYIEDLQDTVLYKNYAVENISEVVVKDIAGIKPDKTFYRYATNDHALMIGTTYGNFVEIKENGINNGQKLFPLLKTVYKKIISDDIVKFVTNDNDDNNIYATLGMNTFNVGDTKYGYYLIKVMIDNTSETFNVRGTLDTDTDIKAFTDIDQIQQLKYINYINGVNITTEQGKNYIKSIFKQICPFMYINLNKYVLNNDIVMYPKAFNLTNMYATIPINETNGSIERDLKFVKQTITSAKKQILQRYTNSIVPLLLKTDYVSNTYNIKLKEIERTLIDTGKFNSIGDSIIYRSSTTIGGFVPYNVYGLNTEYPNLSYKNVVRTYTPIEYKHYNASKMINLEPEILVKAKFNCTYSGLLEAETEENTLKVFTDYLLNINDKFTSDQILFLYNKYSKSYINDVIGMSIDNTEKLYTLTYKFNLY